MITLTTPYSVGGPNISAVSDTQAKCVSCTANWLPTVMTLTAIFEFGKYSTVFNPDGAAPNAMTIQFSLISNTWSASNGSGFSTSGSLTSGQITAVSGIIAAIQAGVQNAGETFAVGSLLPGTVVAG